MEEMEENLNQSVSQNIPSPTEPVVATPAPPTNQPPFGSWWKVGVLAIGVLLTGSVAYASYQYSQKQAPSIAQPTPTSAVIATPTPVTQITPISDETANWKIWTLPDRGLGGNDFLQFKYPSEWKYYTDSGSVGYDDTGNGYYGLNIGFQSNLNNLPLEEFVNSITSFTKTAVKIPVLVGSRKCLQINNQQNGVYYSTIYCQYDDKTILEINASGNKNTNQELLTKILSTFKFTQ